MLARAYNRKIEIWQNKPERNEFGGVIFKPEKVKSIFAKIETSKGSRFEQIGINDFKNPVIFKVRGIKNGIFYDENTFVKYGLKKYIIKAIENVIEDSMEYNIYCSES